MTLPYFRRWKTFGIALLGLEACVLGGGCVHRYTSTLPATYKFAIQSSEPEQYFVRVPHNADYPVPPDGRVTVTFYETIRNTEAKFMDADLLGGHGSSNVKAIYVMKGKSVVKKIALDRPEDFVRKHPVDDQGYWVVTLDHK